MQAAKYNLPSCPKGTTFEGRTFTMTEGETDDSQSPMDLTDVEIELRFADKRCCSAPFVWSLSEKLSLVDAANGVWKIDSFLVGYPITTYDFSAWFIFPDGRTYVYFFGTFQVTS